MSGTITKRENEYWIRDFDNNTSYRLHHVSALALKCKEKESTIAVKAATYILHDNEAMLLNLIS